MAVFFCLSQALDYFVKPLRQLINLKKGFIFFIFLGAFMGDEYIGIEADYFHDAKCCLFSAMN
jgi:hypothetical protein